MLQRPLKYSPFRPGPLKVLPEAEEIVFDWVSWCNDNRLLSYLGNIPPEEYERNYYADTTDPSADKIANKSGAGNPEWFRDCHWPYLF